MLCVLHVQPGFCVYVVRVSCFCVYPMLCCGVRCSCASCCVLLHGSSQVSAGCVGPGSRTVPPHPPCRSSRGRPTVWGRPHVSAETHRVSEGKTASVRQERERDKTVCLTETSHQTSTQDAACLNASCRVAGGQPKEPICQFLGKNHPPQTFHPRRCTHQTNTRSSMSTVQHTGQVTHRVRLDSLWTPASEVASWLTAAGGLFLGGSAPWR